ncbi:MAG: arginine--tRNA ligase, partial [Clostridia bacterium]|nr:arginine--tRNA ligase [Clostridia bacterium]
GAIVFHYLSGSRIKDVNFVMEDALNFDGNTGPYAQYTYARCSSLLEKAGGVPEKQEDYEAKDVEIALIKTLSLFSEKIHDAIRDYEPMVITRYILDVCGDFNRFYHECPIATADTEQARAFRLRLTAATKITLGCAFGLICMQKTEKI